MIWGEAFTYLLIVAIMLIILNLKNYFKTVHIAFQIPGPPALPILGNVFLITNNKKLEGLGTHMSEWYGPIMRIWISVIPFFFVAEPRDLQAILSTNKNNTKNMFYTLLHNFIGEGLITNTGEKWKSHRKLIQPYFHISVLKVFFDAFQKSSNMMVQNLQNKTDVNIAIYANKFVMDVLHDTILGISVKDTDENSPFRKGKVSVPYRLTRPWLLLDTLFNMTNVSKTESQQKETLKDYTKTILKDKRKKLEGLNNNLMEMMMEISKNNPQFSDKDIVNETSTFMLAGQDSVGAALAFTLYFLAADQNVQNKVMEELNGIFEDSNRAETFEDVMEMKYIEQCIKEAMRLCPSVPIITRILTQEVTLGKTVFPAGTNVFISPFITHRLPHIFPNPLQFDPDRFSPENRIKMHPYAYIPFSAGPRSCIGYKFALVEMKTVISQILRNYHLSLIPGHKELDLSYRITLRAKGGIWLRMNKRNIKSS